LRAHAPVAAAEPEPAPPRAVAPTAPAANPAGLAALDSRLSATAEDVATLKAAVAALQQQVDELKKAVGSGGS
jgi:hypothetical protein